MRRLKSLREILQNCPRSATERRISLVTQDSRKVGPESLFFAVAGVSNDGHRFVGEALRAGAFVVLENGNPVAERVLADPANHEHAVEVASTRRALAEASSAFFGHPARRLKVFGVTGTNGKTTTTFLLEAILREAGLIPGLIGTVTTRCGGIANESSHTTPDAPKLQETLASFASLGAKSVAMEVSSHALDQDRVFGIPFAAAVFTNLTLDHLDYHKDMNAYFNAKARLFLEYDCGVRVLNGQDPWGVKLYEACRAKGLRSIRFGTDAAFEIQTRGLTTDLNGIEGTLSLRLERELLGIQVRSPLLGSFNIENIAAAAGAAAFAGISAPAIEKALASTTVPGRLQRVPNQKGVSVLIDYAHSPDALEKALITLRGLHPKRLFCVFGCGGDRDASKRPIMGEIAARLADQVIVTSDNPRTEPPESIVAQVLAGARGAPHVRSVIDRRSAIQAAIRELRAGEMLLIAGKGHEQTQTIGAQKLPFDDFAVAAEYLDP